MKKLDCGITAKNAKDEPRKAGTLPLVIKWNSSVPRPAQSRVVETLRPVSRGTSTVAPNMANMCWTPRSASARHPAGGHRKCPWSNQYSDSLFPPSICGPKKEALPRESGNASTIGTKSETENTADACKRRFLFQHPALPFPFFFGIV